MYNNNFKNNAIMRKIYKLLMSLVAMLAMAPVGLQAQSGNWTDEGNRAAEFSNVSGSTITITSAAEFALLAYNVNNGTHYHGTTFVLGTDLNMVTHYWTPIGTPDNPFRGNFNGANHTIDGITVNTTNNYAGLFGCVKGQEWDKYTPTPQWGPGSEYVKNFVMTNATITGGDYTGAVVGWLPWHVTVENVFCQANVTGGNHVGGLIGREEGKKVTDWYFDTPTVSKCLLTGGTIVATGSDKAALVGSITNYTNYENNFYLDPASAVGNSRDVRAYPVYKSLPNGVTITYNNGSTGVVYNDVYYYPAGTCNFSVDYPLTPTESISVAVNGTQLGNQVGNYQFAVSAETASYTIYVTVSPSGITGDGSVDNPYIINTATQWDICTAAVGAGDSYNGVYFKLGSPITVTTMMGTNDNQPFSGTFDGDGKTLTLDYGKSNDYLNYECAPFYRLNNATIKNLVIAGSIYSSAQHNGGLAVKATGGNNHIENCVSNVSIHSNISGDCTNGGFIGLLNVHETRVYFNGCAFTGKLLGANASDWGGFVGWRLYRTDGQENWSTSYVTFTNCLFAPTEVTVSDGGNNRTFCRSYNNYTTGASYNNCYYNEALQNVDGGRQMHSITAGEGVTLANTGTPTLYSLSGITSYGVGIKYGDVLYAGSGDNVSLTLSGSATNHYICGETALIGHANPYTLRMPNADAVVSAWNVTVPTTIASVSDWNTFCTAVNAGYEYQGETVTMTANVGTFEDPVNTKAGDDNHPFKGTFDGGGKTLTIGFGSSASYSDQKCAPFHRLDNATVKGLVVAGSIYSSAQHNAGIAVTSTDHNTHIENCVSNVSINSNIDGDCSNGGFIGILNTSGGAHVYFNGCAFTGKLLGENTTNWGGFVGWRSWTNNNYCYINFTDCIFFPTTINIATPSGSNSLTFCRAPSGPGASHHNCYYSQVLQVDDGGNQMYSITAGEGVTALENTADAVGTYTVSHIFNYDAGIKFNDVLYAKSGDNVSLNITGTSSTTGHYICGETALLGRENPYTLRMPNADAVISEWNVTPPVTIASVSDWNTFCTAVNAGYNYQGETVTMTANVGTDADPAVTKAGTDDNHPFRGTFDGGGHTLTIGYGSSSSYSDQKCAPFYRLNNATIRNLVVAGHIYSSTQHNGGIATSAYGNNHIKNCVSNVSIHSNRSGSGDAGDCTNGGFIGVLKTNGTYVYFEGCAFTGQLLGENATNWGGFIGWRFYESNNYNDAYFTNCLFAPTTVSIKLEGGNSRPFCRSYNGNGAEYTNCYYTNALQGAFGGKQAYIFTDAPANIGEAGTNYGFVTAYANGLKFAGSHYMAPEAVSLANDAANSTDLSGKNGYFATVTLTDRTLYKDANWNTLCLPFDLALEGSALDGAEARTLSKATFNAGTLTLNFSEPVSELTAGTPYILRWKDASAHLVNPVFSGVTINATASTGITPGLTSGTTGDGSVTFVGTYDPIQYASANRSVLFLGGNSNLYYPDGKSTTTIGACRAYFQLNDITAGDPSDPSSSVRAFVLNFGDENPSGINSLTPALSRGDEAIYNLAGQKLNKMQKGINIINGKKILK